MMAENIIGSATERARRRDPRVRVTSEVQAEGAVHALLREGYHAVALVTGSRGRSEFKGLLLGSVSRAVAARARCPVIVVRGDKAGLTGVHERILLGAADPAAIGEALSFAFREAEARGCVLDVVRAWRFPAHESTDHPGSPRHSHAGASNGRPPSSTSCSRTRSGTTRTSRYAGTRSRARPARCC